MLGSNRENPWRDEACGEGRGRLLPLIQLDLTSQVLKTTYCVPSPEPGTKQQEECDFSKASSAVQTRGQGLPPFAPRPPQPLHSLLLPSALLQVFSVYLLGAGPELRGS